MDRKTRTLTLSALFSALALIVLYLASVWPTGLYGIVAVASLFTAAAVIETGPVSGIYVYVLSSALAMLLLPDKSAPLLFIIFFGYYPILKNLIERIGGKGKFYGGFKTDGKAPAHGEPAVPARAANNIIKWILKLLVFNAALTAVWIFVKDLMFSFGERQPGVLILFIFGNAVFIVFDYGYSKLLRFYIERVSRYIK